MSDKFDIAFIGGGPAGYVGAIRAAQLGMKVAIIDKRKALGGTCLNVGCIPSKALLSSAEHYHFSQKEAAKHGIEIEKMKLNFEALMKRKDQVVDQTTKGIDFLMNKNKITRFSGEASFISANKVKVQADKSEEIEADKIIIATGSEATSLPGIDIDEKDIVSSTGALAMKKVPETLTVIGGGVIGLELGSVYAKLGSKVTVVEFLDRIIPGMDGELASQLQRACKKTGIRFELKTAVQSVKKVKGQLLVEAKKDQGKGDSVSFECEKVLMSVGRRAYTENLNLGSVGLACDERGRVPVNEAFQTEVPSIYAVGDVIAGPMLAHKASEDAVACVESIAGQAGHVDYRLIPGVVYTHPEVAGVGFTEEELKEKKTNYKVGKFPFKALGRARAADETEGFIKVLTDSQSDEILGVHMIGPRVSDMIAQAVTALAYRASAEDIGRLAHAHPTFSEAMKEASLAAWESAIHS